MKMDKLGQIYTMVGLRLESRLHVFTPSFILHLKLSMSTPGAANSTSVLYVPSPIPELQILVLLIRIKY